MIDYFYVFQNIKTKRVYQMHRYGKFYDTDLLSEAKKYRDVDSALSVLKSLELGNKWCVMRVDATLTEVQP